MQLWDRLLPQTILTLNLLRQSNGVPTVSAHQYVHGNFDYNKMLVAPMGCAVQLHQNSERRATWAANLIDGWYLQTSPEHYQCDVIHVKQMKSERVSDTVFFQKEVHHTTYHNPGGYDYQSTQQLNTSIKGKRQCKRIRTTRGTKKTRRHSQQHTGVSPNTS
jgi:hypothetical protein